MTVYLDTSLLVAALTHERDTARAQHWLAAQPAGDCAISDWVVTETSSALAIKLRSGAIGAADRAACLAMFARLARESFVSLPISARHFRTAARFADQHTLGLRAGDALHMAICAEHGAALCTLDARMLAAAPALGVPVRAI